MNKIIRILVVISIAAVIYMNYLAASGYIGGITARYISDKYPTYITPAGYAFAIWGLIYLGMIVFSLYQLFRSDSDSKIDSVRGFFILSCVANIGWIFAWHNQFIGLSVIVMFLLLGSLFVVNMAARNLNGTGDYWLLRTPFSIYFGWVSVATVLNVSIFLISTGLTVGDIGSNIIGCSLLVVLAVIGVVVREKLDIPFYALTIAWAVTAVAVKQSGKTAIVVTCALVVIVLIFSSLTFVFKQDRKTS